MKWGMTDVPLKIDDQRRDCGDMKGERWTNLQAMLRDRENNEPQASDGKRGIPNSHIEVTLWESLGIPKREFHIDIIDMMKRKRSSIEMEGTNLSNNAIQGFVSWVKHPCPVAITNIMRSLIVRLAKDSWGGTRNWPIGLKPHYSQLSKHSDQTHEWLIYVHRVH